MALIDDSHADPLARLLHRDLPERLARDLKSLIERNCLTVRRGNSLIDVPAHPCPPGAAASEAVAADGIGRPLHPGLRAALRVLGVDDDEMPDAVAQAIAQADPHGECAALSAARIIEVIAGHGRDPATARRRLAAALDAFAGATHVRLLSSWESTLASIAHNSLAARHVDTLRRAVLYGSGGERNPSPWSLGGKALQCQAGLAGIDRRYGMPGVDRVRRTLLAGIDELMDERLTLIFDPGAPVCLALCDDPDGRGRDVRTAVTSAGDFREIMTRLLRQSAARTGETISPADDPDGCQAKALALLEQSLAACMNRPDADELLLNIATGFLPAGRTPSREEMLQLPWRLSAGRQLAEVAGIYFNTPITMACSEPAYPSDHGRPQDATHVLRFILDTLAGVRAGLADATGGVPLCVDDQMFSLMPAPLADAWNGGQSPADWIEEKLAAPARAHAGAARAEPPLEELLVDVVALVCHHRDAYGTPLCGRAELLDTIATDADGCYTLRAVFDALSGPGIYPPAADIEALRDCIATAILQVLPPPAVHIADTHLESSTGHGGTDLLCALYNPFRDTVNLHIADRMNDGHAPVKQAWLHAPWEIMTTLRHRDRAAVTT